MNLRFKRFASGAILVLFFGLGSAVAAVAANTLLVHTDQGKTTINRNIFNQHCDRVKMANIAQTINVLQAMILTDKERMILTPTYHVFEMYTVHHDATLLPAELTCADYERGGAKLPGLHVSASKDKAGKVCLTLCNLNPNETAPLRCEFDGAFKAKSALGRVLTAPGITACNTFEKPDVVRPERFDAYQFDQGNLTIQVPARSVVVLTVE